MRLLMPFRLSPHQAIAKKFAAEGMSVCIVRRPKPESMKSLMALKEKIEEDGGKCFACRSPLNFQWVCACVCACVCARIRDAAIEKAANVPKEYLREEGVQCFASRPLVLPTVKLLLLPCC